MGLFVRFYLLWAEKTNKKNVMKHLAYDLQWHRWFEKRNRFSFLALFSFVEDFRSLSVDRVFVSVGMTMLTSGLLTYYETNRCNSDAFCMTSVRFCFALFFVRGRTAFDCPAVWGCPSFTCWAWLLPFSSLAWCSLCCFPSIWGLFYNRDNVAFLMEFLLCFFYFLPFFLVFRFFSTRQCRSALFPLCLLSSVAEGRSPFRFPQHTHWFCLPQNNGRNHRHAGKICSRTFVNEKMLMNAALLFLSQFQ